MVAVGSLSWNNQVYRRKDFSNQIEIIESDIFEL